MPFPTATSQLTRLGPSIRVPGRLGVFCTQPIKKFTPLEIVPEASCMLPSSINSSATPVVVAAPPCVIDLANAPRTSISLRRFLALRGQFSSGQFLHAATAQGWYLLLPAATVALPDPEGLRAWNARHHHRYLQHRPTSTLRTPAVTRRQKAAELAGWDEVLEMCGELSRADLERVGQEIATEAAQPDDEETNETDDTVESEERTEPPVGAAAALHQRFSVEDANAQCATGSAPVLTDGASPPSSQVLRQIPWSIPEAHLFAINDGVPWAFPPADDLASPAYWEAHRDRMRIYAHGGGGVHSEAREAVVEWTLRAARTPPPDALPQDGGSASSAAQPTAQELLADSESLFEVLSQRANVRLHVDDDTGLVTLTPLLDLKAGDELLLHYGREWWSERLLSMIFLAVPNAEISGIRWIETLFTEPTDVFKPFPHLIAARREERRRGTQRRRLLMEGGGSTGPLVLFNTASQNEATDDAVLAYAVRQSCTDHRFLTLLLRGDAHRTSIFDPARGDVEVPMKALRQALLYAVRGYPQDKAPAQPPAAPLLADEGDESATFTV